MKSNQIRAPPQTRDDEPTCYNLQTRGTRVSIYFPTSRHRSIAGNHHRLTISLHYWVPFTENFIKLPWDLILNPQSHHTHGIKVIPTSIVQIGFKANPNLQVNFINFASNESFTKQFGISSRGDQIKK